MALLPQLQRSFQWVADAVENVVVAAVDDVAVAADGVEAAAEAAGEAAEEVAAEVAVVVARDARLMDRSASPLRPRWLGSRAS